MNTASILRAGLAAGVTAVVLYIGCMLTMLVLPEDTLIRFFNSLMHGLDVTPIMRHDVPVADALIGIVSWFIIGGLLGVIFAAVYRAGTPEHQ